jgi:hypothetical protein
MDGEKLVYENCYRDKLVYGNIDAVQLKKNLFVEIFTVTILCVEISL